MRSGTAVLAAALVLLVAGCGTDDDVPAAPTPTPTTTPRATTSPTPTATPTPPESPTPSSPSPTPATDPCDATEVLAEVETALIAARLVPDVPWSDDTSQVTFAARTTDGDEYARRLGLDCGTALAAVLDNDEERLLVVAWTGSRTAWTLQTTELPSTPYEAEATVDVLVGWTSGEWLDEDRTTWAGTLATGETFVVGHHDFNLGAAAKEWLAGDAPVDDDRDLTGLLAAEQHGILTLEAAGMREIDIAQPAQVGSQEGYLQFVSPTGQISVADVAPDGWFDPLEPRYYTGPTRIETIDGVQVRITEPGADAPDWAVAVEVGFHCDAFVWLLEPPMNGDADEAIASATAILATPTCRAG